MGARLELLWPNKEKFLLVPKDDTGKPVWVDRTHPAASEVRLSTFTGEVGDVDPADPHADSLLFTGDSLDVLRILTQVPEFARHHRGKAKLVYIDPPFNTGRAFKDYDDWMEHSTWLSFMRERLLLIKDLLGPEGTLWLHLDNFEVHRMRVLLDEVFGADNYLNTVVWKRTGAKSSARRGMGTMYDNILIYGRSPAATLNPVLIPHTEEYLRTKYGAEDDRGRYQTTSLTAPGIRTGDSGQPWQGIDPTDKGRHWGAPQAEELLGPRAEQMTTREKLDALLEAGYIQLPSRPGGTPRFKFYLQPGGGTLLGDFWNDINVLNSQGKERVNYDTQKPELLLQRVIEMATGPGDLVVDCFGGSATTAAVAHKLGRRWVTCDILPASVDEFALPRMTRVVTGDDDSGSSKAAGWTGGGGFRTIEIGPTMYETGPGGSVLLADWATNGKFAQAVAAQLHFTYTPDTAPLCGVRGRMRLAVLDGAAGAEEISELLRHLGEDERLTVVAKVLLPGAEEALRRAAPGSRIRKAPRDLLEQPRRRRAPKSTIESDQNPGGTTA